MWKAIQKYWDIFGGVVVGISMTMLAKFQLYKVQLYYSMVILILVDIGVLRIIKQAVEKSRKERKHNIIDSMVDSQRPMKAIRIAQNPMKDGEVLGNIVIKIWEGTKKTMKKLSKFFDKFKGIVLAIALGILTAVEFYGGFINSLFGDALTIGGIEVLPFITLIAALTVGIISNGFTKEQSEKIKALFSKSSTNELVVEHIKKTIKENSAELSQQNKLLSTKETELDNLGSHLLTANNTYQAKKEMYNMTPQLATADDVRLASEAVADIQTEIAIKTKEIEETKTTIDNLQTTINALKSKL
jgi:hypothetical protein